ncbi:hypothetical protein QQS21_002979 [Conoideocrella luteorostrata]|uniref:C2H2-type domain-containing protein n=1 Tax=Conoideocrella luteorostrata TaxID=1105319 RepID=A0AAJ0CYA7_9HYPO|nr:hypothetical protein QQS21_002979 [Conoideocrella luteorostrata]
MSSASSPSYMMTPESDMESPLAISPSTHGHNARVIIRQLLERHTREEINQILIEEDLTSGSYGHVRLPDAAFSQPFHGSGRDNLPPQMAVVRQNGTPYPPYVPNSRRAVSSNLPPPKPQRQSTTDPGTSVPSAPQRLDYACGFCAEENIRKTCTRRNDLRRHIENFHNKNAVWFCQHPGCRMAYDWQSAYQTHLRNAHGRSHMNVDEAMVKVCPQMVFACGFENCTRVFEAPSEEEAVMTLKEYSGHIVKHFEEGCNSGRWSYSTRIRNLLRQSQVAPLWEKAWPELEAQVLQWDPQTSMAARKILEAGHLENLPYLIRFMIVLATNTGDLTQFEGTLEPPVRERCPAPYRHKFSHETHAQSPRLDSERDISQFKVSGSVALEYAPYGSMQPGQQVPRSVEQTFSSESTIDRGRQTQCHYGDAGTAMRQLTPPLFYHGPGSAIYCPSPAILPTALPSQQHPPGQYVPVAQETESVVSQAGFHGMQPLTTSISGGMDVDMSGGSVHADAAGVPSGRENWMGHYPQMAMHSSMSPEGYDLGNPVKSEHSHMIGGFVSPRNA